MAGRFGATVAIDRPIEEVFAFLADGENDKKFNARVVEIAKTTDGPPGVGTVYASAVKDAGMQTQREFKLTEFEARRRRSAGPRSPRTWWSPQRAATTWLRPARPRS